MRKKRLYYIRVKLIFNSNHKNINILNGINMSAAQQYMKRLDRLHFFLYKSN